MKARLGSCCVLLALAVLSAGLGCQDAGPVSGTIGLRVNQDFSDQGIGLRVVAVEATSGVVSGIQRSQDTRPREAGTYEVTVSITNEGSKGLSLKGADLATIDPTGVVSWHVDTKFKGGPIHLEPGAAHTFARDVTTTVRNQVTFVLALYEAEGNNVALGPFTLRF